MKTFNNLRLTGFITLTTLVVMGCYIATPTLSVLSPDATSTFDFVLAQAGEQLGSGSLVSDGSHWPSNDYSAILGLPTNKIVELTVIRHNGGNDSIMGHDRWDGVTITTTQNGVQKPVALTCQLSNGAFAFRYDPAQGIANETGPQCQPQITTVPGYLTGSGLNIHSQYAVRASFLPNEQPLTYNGSLTYWAGRLPQGSNEWIEILENGVPSTVAYPTINGFPVCAISGTRYTFQLDAWGQPLNQGGCTSAFLVADYPSMQEHPYFVHIRPLDNFPLPPGDSTSFYTDMFGVVHYVDRRVLPADGRYTMTAFWDVSPSGYFSEHYYDNKPPVPQLPFYYPDFMPSVNGHHDLCAHTSAPFAGEVLFQISGGVVSIPSGSDCRYPNTGFYQTFTASLDLGHIAGNDPDFKVYIYIDHPQGYYGGSGGYGNFHTFNCPFGQCSGDFMTARVRRDVEVPAQIGAVCPVNTPNPPCWNNSQINVAGHLSIQGIPLPGSTALVRAGDGDQMEIRAP